MTSTPLLGGRPRVMVDIGLLLALRSGDDSGRSRGWQAVAMAYTHRTGNFISKQTCRRRYHEWLQENGRLSQ